MQQDMSDILLSCCVVMASSNSRLFFNCAQKFGGDRAKGSYFKNTFEGFDQVEKVFMGQRTQTGE